MPIPDFLHATINGLVAFAAVGAVLALCLRRAG